MSIARFDHAVLLANEEPRAREFYVEYLGAKVEKTFVRNREGRELHRSFLLLEEGQGLGLFEDRTAVPPPRATREWPAVAFQVSQERFDKAVDSLEGEIHEMALPNVGPTFYTHDSEGNAIGLSSSGNGGGTLLLRFEIDTPRLEEAVSYYGDIFGLGTPESGLMPGELPYAYFAVGDERQGVLAVEHPEAPGANPGQHFAFLVGRADHTELKSQLEERGGKEVPGHEGERPDGEISTYMRDPWQRKLQWITHVDTQ